MIKTIKYGDKGDQVRIAKYLTKYAARGKANSTFNSDFEEHVEDWQKDNKLPVTGEIDSVCWKIIAKNAPTCSTSRNRTSRYTYALQIALEGTLVEDGIFGAKTKAAVVAFQAAAGLVTDGICGPKTWAALLLSEVDKGSSGSTETPEHVEDTVAKKYVQPVDYKQGDSRWGSKMYSCYGNKKQTMKNSGCGPTAMADVVATLIDSNIDPYDLAELSMANGHRSRSGGTAWSFFPYIQEKFRFSKMVQTDSFTAFKECLDKGGYVVCSMGPDYWTKGGHFICAWKYDDTYVYANDPASSSRKKQKVKEFKADHKEYFCFYK